MIDSHCHLADKAFDADREAVIERARRAGVSPLITIADTLAEGEKCIDIAREHEDIFCTVGVHPHHAKDWKNGDAEALLQLLTSSPKVRAVGEIGLDYHYDFSPRDIQQHVFREQLAIAMELGIPSVIHNRESIADLWKIVQNLQPQAAVLHCCTETWEDIRPWVERGYYLSFTGIATYAKSDAIRTVISNCPLEQIMVETDAPYLAPVPHRGKRNEPAFVAEVARTIAEVKGMSAEEVDGCTTENAIRFFGLPVL